MTVFCPFCQRSYLIYFSFINSHNKSHFVLLSASPIWSFSVFLCQTVCDRKFKILDCNGKKKKREKFVKIIISRSLNVSNHTTLDCDCAVAPIAHAVHTIGTFLWLLSFWCHVVPPSGLLRNRHVPRPLTPLHVVRVAVSILHSAQRQKSTSVPRLIREDGLLWATWYSSCCEDALTRRCSVVADGGGCGFWALAGQSSSGVWCCRRT